MTNDTKPIPAGVLPELPVEIEVAMTQLSDPDTVAFSVRQQLRKHIRDYATEAVKQGEAAMPDSEKLLLVKDFAAGKRSELYREEHGLQYEALSVNCAKQEVYREVEDFIDALSATAPTKQSEAANSREDFERWHKRNWPLVHEQWKAGLLKAAHDPDIVTEDDIEEMLITWNAALSQQFSERSE